MPTALKFNRFVRLSISPDDDDFAVDDRVISELKMVFKVTRSIDDNTHYMTMDIYNVSTKGSNDQVKFLPDRGIQLEAGYEEINGTVFKGLIRNSITYRDGADIITRLYCLDTQRLQDPYIAKSYTEPFNLNTLINDLVEEAGLKVVRQSIRFKNNLGAQVFEGKFRNIMNTLGKAHGFNFYVYNQEVYLFDSELGNLSQATYEINATTGLLESPVLTGLGINVKTMMEPKLKPNDRFVVRSGGLVPSADALEYNKLLTTGLGEQQVQTVIITGDTHGDEWYTEIVGKRITEGVL